VGGSSFHGVDVANDGYSTSYISMPSHNSSAAGVLQQVSSGCANNGCHGTDPPTIGWTVPVGNQPLAVRVNPNGVQAYTVNQFDGTVTPVELPADAPITNTADINWLPGVTRSNLVPVKLSAGGAVNIENDQGNVDVIVDVLGYYS
jgi:hypothetical protein